MSSILSDIQRVPVDSIQTHPENPRRGDIPAIAESLRVNEQYEPIVVQRSTGYVLAGNHRLLAARELGWEEIAVVFVDVDDDHATRIMLSSNRTGDLGSYDLQLLVDHLRHLSDSNDLAGTGYTDDDLDSRMAELHRNLNETRPDSPAPPPSSIDLREVVLLFSPEQHAQFEAWMNEVAKARETNGPSETVYAALEIASVTLNG